MQIRQKITPFLSFRGNAEEAVHHWLTIFGDSETDRVLRTPAADGQPGQVIAIEFHIADSGLVALNVDQDWEFTEAISLIVLCETQAEIDGLWEKLTEGGAAIQCGWLKDRFGVFWQIVPTILLPMLNDPDPAKAGRAMQAMMGMTKFDIDVLQRAHRGK